jgi:hypothetical protein
MMKIYDTFDSMQNGLLDYSCCHPGYVFTMLNNTLGIEQQMNTIDKASGTEKSLYNKQHSRPIILNAVDGSPSWK